MGMVDTPERRGKKGRRKSKRIGFHLDMTPMVDVAFLLLTFFMLTTTFAKSNTMEINIPPETGEVSVAERNVMTLRVPGDGYAYWSLAEEAPRRASLYERSDASHSTLSHELRQALQQQFAANRKLVVLVKISEKAKYKSLVDIIDELNLLKIDRFSLDDFTPQDDAEVQRSVALR